MTTLDTSLPPAMFDLDETGELTPPIFESVRPGEYGPRLTPYGAHHGIGPGVWDDMPSYCGDAHYGSVEDGARRVWVWHVCSSTGQHDEHKCARCDETWPVV